MVVAKAVQTGSIKSPTGQAAHITDFTKTAVLTGVDTGTEMTAAQAATIVADLAALAVAVNAILVALENVGITAKA
jgi:hypothetical protein